MKEKTIKEYIYEIEQCANIWKLKKTINNLKGNTYYYYVYFDSTRPFCIIRKFKNAIWKEEVPYCSIYDDIGRALTLIPNSSYELVKEKDYIYVKFFRGYAGVFYITKSLQTAHNVLRKECRCRKPNIMHASNTTFYKKCMKILKEFTTNPSLKEIYAIADL